MHIKVEEFSDLCETYPELKTVSDITANHGEENDISKLCEVIAFLYRRIDNLQQKPSANVRSLKTEK